MENDRNGLVWEHLPCKSLKDKHLSTFSMSSEYILLSVWVSLQTLKRFQAARGLTRFDCVFERSLKFAFTSTRHQFSVVCFFERNDYYVCWKRCSVWPLALSLFFYFLLSFFQWPLCWRMITLFGEQAYQGGLRQKKWSFIGVQAMDLKALNTASMAGVTLWR